MRFSPCPQPTVGVEWELQLLDPETLDLVDGIMPLMEFFPNTSLVKPEYIQSCVELTTRVCNDCDEAVADLRETLIALLRRCEELEMTLCGAGTHSFCRRLALITPLPRYERIAKDAGFLSHTQITFSTHVHVGMRSGDEAMHAMSHLVPALPVLVALSANSPLWRGHETGHAAYRHRILAAAPNYGMPPRFRDWQEYDEFLSAATAAGMIRHFKDVHWDIRPHPDFGTLEIRAMDAASDLVTLHALASFVRALVVAMARANSDEIADVVPPALPHWVRRENLYRAAHHGIAADYIVDKRGGHRPIRYLAADLIEFCRPTAAEIHESKGLKLVEELLGGTLGYERQLEAYAGDHAARSAVRALNQLLLESAREPTARYRVAR